MAPMSVSKVDPKLLKLHPLAHLIPNMRDSEWQDFYADIAMRGIKVPLETLADGTVLDGKHRLRAAIELGMKEVPIVNAALSGDSPEAYMLKAAVLRRHLTDDQRAMMAAMWKDEHSAPRGKASSKYGKSAPYGADIKDAEHPTREEATKMFRVSRKKVDEASKLLSSEPDIFNQVHSGELSLKQARKKIKEGNAQKQREALKGVHPQEDNRYKLLQGDLAEKCQELPPESIDVIITDPPYSEKYLDVYSVLAEAAKLLLKPGGSLLVLTGQSYLPEVFKRMTPHLTYHWIVAYLTPGGQSPQLWQKKVNTFWKPVLWFTKGIYSGEWVGDVVRSAVNDNDKSYHQWGQSESGFSDLVKRFSKEGDVILDPCMGAGTTGVVAIRLNRRFIGIDISADQVAIARGRISKVSNAAALSYATI